VEARTRQSVAQKIKSGIEKQENATSEEHGIINRFTLNDRQNDSAVLGSDSELVTFLELQIAQVHLVDVETDDTLLVDVRPARTLEIEPLHVVKGPVIADKPQHVVLECRLMSNAHPFHDRLGVEPIP